MSINTPATAAAAAACVFARCPPTDQRTHFNKLSIIGRARSRADKKICTHHFICEYSAEPVRSDALQLERIHARARARVKKHPTRRQARTRPHVRHVLANGAENARAGECTSHHQYTNNRKATKYSDGIMHAGHHLAPAPRLVCVRQPARMLAHMLAVCVCVYDFIEVPTV